MSSHLPLVQHISLGTSLSSKAYWFDKSHPSLRPRARHKTNVCSYAKLEWCPPPIMTSSSGWSTP
eukprot:m.90921 g.90921  ORF g.90921 m.90921 type:complete len:65 (-) comp14885_c0_seq6:1059-1253(-)